MRTPTVNRTDPDSTKPQHLLPVLVWIGLWLLAAACGEQGRPSGRDRAGKAIPAGTPNLLLITIDTLRADALGFSGNAQAVTPTLDRLAATGRIYPNTHAHSVTTLPSHASMLTGRYPNEHGARQNGTGRLRQDLPTVATLMAEAGYRTAAFVAAFPLDSRFGLDRGFELYDDDLRDDPGDAARDDARATRDLLYNERAGHVVLARAQEWWRAHAGERRFLWIHLFDPHAPYSPPEPWATTFAHYPYLGEVAATDAYLAPFLAPFLDGREDPALVVVTADHGESLGEHGEATHGLFAYEATLRVPLILWGKGVDPGVDSRAARLVDLLPTWLEASGLDAPGDLPGRSLLAAPGPDTGSYFEALSGYADYGWAPLRGMLRDGLKWIDLPIPELYDLNSNPQEDQNLFGERRRETAALTAALPAGLWPPKAAAISPESARRLQSLGYAGGGGGQTRIFTPEDDPKALVHLDQKAGQMLDHQIAGRHQEAIALGREILAERPDMGMVALHLATAWTLEGESEEALRALETANRAGASNPSLLRQLGLSLLGAGRAQEAMQVLEPLVDGDPKDLEAQNHLALALAAEGQLAEARAQLEDALVHAPDDAHTLESFSYLALLEGKATQAETHARDALAQDSKRPNAWNNLGVALHRQDRIEEALATWKKGILTIPEDPEMLFNLGALYLELERYPEAKETLSLFRQRAKGQAFADKRARVDEILGQL